MIQISNGSIKRDDFHLDNINLEIKPNSMNIIVGKNSAGKSSLLYTLTGAIVLQTGTLKDKFIRKAFVSNDAPFISLVLLNDLPSRVMLLDPHFDKSAYYRYLEYFNISSKEMFQELSVGQQKLVQLSIALAREVDLLLLDEINLNVDAINEKKILNLLEEYISKGHNSVVVSTNKLELFEDLSDQLIYIRNNSIAYQGDIDSFINTYTIYNGNLDEIEDKKTIKASIKGKYSTEFLLENTTQGERSNVSNILRLIERSHHNV